MASLRSAGVLILLGFAALACDDVKSVNEPPSIYTDAIANRSFEAGGMFTLAGWVQISPGLIDSIHDAPSGGGTWSVGISDTAASNPTALIFTIAAPAGKRFIRFSVLSRFAYGTGSGGKAIVQLQNGDSVTVVHSFPISDSLWTKFGSTDTLNLPVGQSLQVLLEGGTNGTIRSRTIFDLCRLEVSW